MGSALSRGERRKVAAVEVTGTTKASDEGAMSSSIVHTLTEIQIEEFREAFNAFDKDGGGSIDKFELMDLFKSLGQNPSEEELDNMIRCADTDGNGTIDFYEVRMPRAAYAACHALTMASSRWAQFSTLMAHLMFSQDSKEAKCERLRAAFKIFDTDNNGTISTDEMRNIMCEHLSRIALSCLSVHLAPQCVLDLMPMVDVAKPQVQPWRGVHARRCG